MTKISQYPEVALPDVEDLLVGTDVENSNATKNFTIQSIVDLVSAEAGITPTLQQVTIAGNTTINDITANKFKIPGGTSSEILAANGDVITAGANITISGGTISSSGGGGGTGPAGPQGPIGPQGVAGTNGVPGPVGPAGLNWQGAWVSGTSYVADDAVGYGGASYFCILATSGTTTPNLDTTNWALLASQGAQGIQGVQGPTGAQGPAGANGIDTYRGQWDYTGDTTYTVGDIVTSFTYSNDFQYQMRGTYRCIEVPEGNFNPGVDGISWVQLGLTQLAKGTRLKGAGTAADPITLKGYKIVSYIYATGTGNPQRSVNFFNGMELPTGVTETIVRVSTGSYELRYTALDGNTFVNNLGVDNFFQYLFSMNPNIVYGGSFTTTSGGNRTLVIGFQNKPAGVLTDGFSTVNYSMEWFE